MPELKVIKQSFALTYIPLGDSPEIPSGGPLPENFHCKPLIMRQRSHGRSPVSTPCRAPFSLCPAARGYDGRKSRIRPGIWPEGHLLRGIRPFGFNI